ncbi:hypothetical protein GQ457_18G007600 [Hibiscus cannabinus]
MYDLPDPLIEHYLEEVRFLHASKIIGGAKLDVDLINAFLERWRLETHTFHLSCGDATITLLDISYILGLLVDREVITGLGTDDWHGLCLNYLEVILERFDGGKIRLLWL